MPRYIDKDALLEILKVNKYAEPSTEFQRGANANADLIFGEIKWFPEADVVPRAEVAREIVNDVKDILLDYYLQEDKKYTQSLSKTKKQFDIQTARYRAITEAIKFALETLNETEDKYTEDRK